MKRFKPQRLALMISMAFAAPALMAQQSTDVGRINVEGQTGGTDTGMIS